jgi:signal peptidase I
MTKIRKIAQILYISLFSVIIISMAFVYITTYSVIPGYQFYVVLSGSMEPAIPTGSVIAVTERDSYDVDDIITFTIKEDPPLKFTHRVVEKKVQSEAKYITKGDANEYVDLTPVEEEKVVGKTILTIPFVGYFANFIQKPLGLLLLVILPAIVILASEITIIERQLFNFCKKKEKNDV